MRHRKERQLLLFEITYRKSKPNRLPGINETQAAEIIAKEWRMLNGSLVPEDQASYWASQFFRCMRFEPIPIWMPPKPKKRPERPTAERLRRFIGLETDWVRATE
ncbi:hypothetical protein ACYOEI_06840 [Singulisphaera rosea]